MRLLVVLLTLVAVGWLVLGFVLGAVTWSWMGPPALLAFLATELWRWRERRLADKRLRNRLARDKAGILDRLQVWLRSQTER